MPIPKIIHQIWMQGLENLPDKYARYSKSWRSKNPNWQYIVWNETQIEQMIQQHYPHLLECYYTYDDVIARSDIGRYVILAVFGGMYADMDTICMRSVEKSLSLEKYSLYVQTFDDPLSKSKPKISRQIFQATNSIILCEVNHPLIQDCLQYIYDANGSKTFWMNITGPPMYAKCLSRYYKHSDDKVRILNHEYIIRSFRMSKFVMLCRALLSRKCFSVDYNDTGRKALQIEQSESTH